MKKHLGLVIVGAIAVAGAGGGIAAATMGSSAGAATASGSTMAHDGTAAVNVATVSVNGKTERVLVTAKGLPLYTYAGDTGSVSHVSGELAALWPPLTSRHPSESGVNGQLSVVQDANGPQVRYDGHFLYTFVSDTPGHVTGQGVQNFFVAVPGGATALSTHQTAPSTAGRSYGY